MLGPIRRYAQHKVDHKRVSVLFYLFSFLFECITILTLLFFFYTVCVWRATRKYLYGQNKLSSLIEFMSEPEKCKKNGAKLKEERKQKRKKVALNWYSVNTIRKSIEKNGDYWFKRDGGKDRNSFFFAGNGFWHINFDQHFKCITLLPL